MSRKGGAPAMPMALDATQQKRTSSRTSCPKTRPAAPRQKMIGPMPGTLINRAQPWSCRASVSISPDRLSMRSSSRCQSPTRSSTMRKMRGESTSVRRRQDARQLGPQETRPLPYRDAALQQKGTDLIDNAGPRRCFYKSDSAPHKGSYRPRTNAPI
jgi:hypothetical protein